MEGGETSEIKLTTYKLCIHKTGIKVQISRLQGKILFSHGWLYNDEE